MKTLSTFSPAVHERAIRWVFEHRGEHESLWAAIGSMASKIGCTAETWRSGRLLEPIGPVPLAEVEPAYYRQQEASALAA